MQKRSWAFAAVFTTILTVYFSISSITVFAGSTILKEGMKGGAVTSLQTDLKTLGYFNASPTGYYGSLTATAVKSLQRKHGLKPDGIAGKDTFSLINRLKGGTQSATSTVSSQPTQAVVLKKGMRSSSVTELQHNLKQLGFFSAVPTGYYGDITVSAVKKLQARHGLTQDGIAGKNTLSLINSLVAGNGKVSTQSVSTQSTAVRSVVSRGGVDRESYLTAWFGGVDGIFKRDDTASVYDIETGLEFFVKRTYGTNHADCETLTAEDTKIMKEVFGGQWSWERRAVIVTVNGKSFAGSMSGMPHAGKDNAAADAYVSSRSGGFGAGVNYDAVKGNNMDGHFCIHFYNSKTHGSAKIDAGHQEMVKKAAEWARLNH